MIYDGDCSFCSFWVKRWDCVTGGQVSFLQSRDPEVAVRFPEVPGEQLETAVCLIQTDGAVCSGAEAAFRVLACNPRERWLLDWYEHSAAFARISERVYRFVARHRGLFSLLTRLAWGRHVEPPSYLLVRSVFLRALGLIYLAAFVSLWVQVSGLVGYNGIQPAGLTMNAVREAMAAQQAGFDRYHLFPTLGWLGAGDAFLKAQCAAGTGLAVLLVFGLVPAPCLLLLWLIYLSLTTLCGEFLSFQWDNLLLEAGFLAIFLSPLQWRLRAAQAAAPSRLMLWLLRWLQFRLMFESGCVKLLSGDPTWRNLTALDYHYETQPLPTWIGWYAYQVPHWAQKASVLLMFGIELGVPFLVFGPRRLRQLACVALVTLQVLISLTGNYCFFNLLAIALCLPLLDDFALRRFLPAGCRSSTTPVQPATCNLQPSILSRPRWPVQVTVPLVCVTLAVSLMQFSGLFGLRLPWPAPMVGVASWLAPFRSLNTYGLSAVMTTSRAEIIIEGSNDGVTWRAYEFKYKPGNVKRRPRFVEPHQPRLDWQMWFAALGNYRQNPWLVNFCVRLLRGSRPVLALLEHDPFPNAPPRYVRAVVYDYHFTDWTTFRRTGAWWRREPKGIYLPPISLREVESAELKLERAALSSSLSPEHGFHAAELSANPDGGGHRPVESGISGALRCRGTNWVVGRRHPG